MKSKDLRLVIPNNAEGVEVPYDPQSGLSSISFQPDQEYVLSGEPIPGMLYSFFSSFCCLTVMHHCKYLTL